uniref:Uncharacterized protein n=1 Tax=Guillardia theta TaxID=55529 RepID=A0A7S4UN20_GUITH
MTEVDPNVQPPPGLERRLWATKKRIPSEVRELVNPTNTYSRVFQGLCSPVFLTPLDVTLLHREDAGIDYSMNQPEVKFSDRTQNLRNRETNGKVNEQVVRIHR